MEAPAKSPKSDHHLFTFIEVFGCEGGIQTYVKDVLRAYEAAALRSSGGYRYTADVLLLRDPKGCDNPFDHVPRKPQSLFQFHYLKLGQTQTIGAITLGRLRFILALIRQLIFDRPSCVFCGHINFAPLTRLFCRWFKVPYVVMTYGKEVWEALPPSQVRALLDAKSIWTISRYSRDRAVESNHLPPENFELLPCVVDGDRFTPAPKPAHLLDRYQLRDARVLMTVARLWSGDPYKGVDVTIRALPKIAAVYPNVKYLAIGRGDDLPRLQQLAIDLGVADRVVFAGFVATEDLVDHYRVADAYVMPSQEGFGIVYLEAMAAGIPVLSGDSDGSADPLQDGRLGWQVPHRDPDAVAAACIEMLRGEDRRCDGAWLRRETLASFSTEAIARRLRELFAS
jgi:glycosyltransferase involved in cell wall biosynthesis